MSRYIDADAMKKQVESPYTEYPIMIQIRKTLKDFIEDAPSIDIVRCQDCKHWVYNFNGCSRNPCTEPWYATDFCNYGEREGE